MDERKQSNDQCLANISCENPPTAASQFDIPGTCSELTVWVDEPESSQVVCPNLVIRDNTHFRSVWLMVVAFALLYVATFLPFRIAFIEFFMAEELEVGPVAEVVVWLVDAVFGIDLVLNFFFSFRDAHEREVLCMKRIAIRYLSGSFCIDLISCIPPAFFQIILQAILQQDQQRTSAHKTPWLAKLHRVPRLAKLIRILRLAKIFNFARNNNFIERLRSNRAARVMYFIFGFVIIAHIVASGWYLVAALHNDPETTWIWRRYVATEEDFYESSPLKDWLHSMYFVLTVFTTVGFGDMSAYTVGEMIFVILTMIIGTMANGIIMGEMINSIAVVDAVSNERNEQTRLLQSFSEHTQLSEKVKHQLLNFIRRTGDVHRTYERNQIKLLIMRNVFPRALEQQVPEALFHGQLLKNRLFKYCRRLGPLPFQLPLFVALAVHQKFMVTNDMAYVAGDQPNSIHLVLTGVFASLTRRRNPHTADRPLWHGVLNHTDTFNQGSMVLQSPETRSEDPKRSGSKKKERFVEKNEFFPFQLYCRRSYFGDMEVMQDLVVRRDSVRCESDGSMLVIEKHDVAGLAKEFPRHIILLRQAAARRWARSRRSVGSYQPYRSYQDTAAWTIQKFWLILRQESRQKESAGTQHAVEGISVRVLAASEIAAQGGLPAPGGLSPCDNPKARQSLSMANALSGMSRESQNGPLYPGKKLVHHGDIFTPSIQSEVDRVRSDLYDFRCEMADMQNDLGTLNGKLDKVIGVLQSLANSRMTPRSL